jgi:hypothetical protein
MSFLQEALYMIAVFLSSVMDSMAYRVRALLAWKGPETNGQTQNPPTA